ncbi:DHA2 family multidrug resistance protein-like MFS transporter [Ochrobactrum daejeonense]|uniref:DHA2 family multidrug resistance protein-like MFS transporter n=1 Tax=Brucella daejeonensis TaxID=659015 RepID=A0A7W9AYR1_9HYPH|nr:MFS transporter [Brucella daejeonensis]MBB5703070.1 DHA2 family multidrug resistance protein-like MFS transporter [Brucella daejeonensis]NKB79257.1 MFS transporter [Brucella daejeonensis]
MKYETAILPAAPTAPDGLPKPKIYWAWATLMVGLTLAVIDGTIANVALPTIAADFSAGPSASIWIVNGYQLAIVVTLLPLAALGEIYGYRHVYVAGVSLFTVASVACVFSRSLEALTFARIMQGLGAAGLMSVNTALLRYTVPQAKFGTAIGLNALFVAVSSTIGPTLAGIMLSSLSWPWLFVINIPLGIAAVLMGLGNLPDNERSARRFDVVSAVLTALTIGLLVTTIDSAGNGVGSSAVLVQALCCLIAGVLLTRRSLRMADPLLPLDLLRIPVFTLSICTSIMSFLAQMMAFISLPFLFQLVFGFKPIEVGFLMMPWPIALAVVAPLSGRLSDRHSPAILGLVGLVTFAAGLALVGMLPDRPTIPDICWRLAICGVGFGLFQAPNNRMMITATPRSRSGAASGMLGTARLLGQSLGAAFVAFLLAQWGVEGTPYILFFASGFAMFASLISAMRLGR